MVAICAVYKFSRGLTYFVAAVVEFVVNIFMQQWFCTNSATTSMPILLRWHHTRPEDLIRCGITRKITHPQERVEESSLSKPQGHTTSVAALEKCRQDISMDESLGVYTFPIFQQLSFEIRPRGYGVLSCALPGIRHTSGEW